MRLVKFLLSVLWMVCFSIIFIGICAWVVCCGMMAINLHLVTEFSLWLESKSKHSEVYFLSCMMLSPIIFSPFMLLLWQAVEVGGGE